MSTTKARSADSVVAVLKVGGLVFSAGLTLNLFTRLFGLTPFGIVTAVAALALFEGGAAGWAYLLEKGREAQRTVAVVCLIVTTALSIFSSGSEIILATKFGAGAFAAIDFEFWTLAAIVVALATVVVGAMFYEAMKPETRAAARQAGFEARLAEINYSAQDQVIDLAEGQTNEALKYDAPELARLIKGRAMGDVTDATRRLAARHVQPTAIEAPEWPRTNLRATAPAPVSVVAGGGDGFDPASVTMVPDDLLDVWADAEEAASAPVLNKADAAPKAKRPTTTGAAK